MDIKTRLQQDLKEAMKSKDVLRRNTVRSIQAAIKQVEVDERKELDDTAVIKILKAEAKKRHESIDAYEQGNRQDDADAERAELAIIEIYLPEQMSREQVKAIAQEVISEVGATSSKEMGKIMPVMLKRLKGQADGKLVNEVIREILD
jgi:hypothetical protein